MWDAVQKRQARPVRIAFFAFAVIVCYCHRYYLAARASEKVSCTKRDDLRHSYQLCHLRRRRNEFSKNESRNALGSWFCASPIIPRGSDCRRYSAYEPDPATSGSRDFGK